MRRISGLAAAAVMAAGVIALQPGASQAAPQPKVPASLASDGTTFRVTDTITDPNGATHVRMERTYRGLPVLGGDLVVHRGAQGGLKSVSETLESAVQVATTPAVSKAASTAPNAERVGQCNAASMSATAANVHPMNAPVTKAWPRCRLQRWKACWTWACHQRSPWRMRQSRVRPVSTNMAIGGRSNNGQAAMGCDTSPPESAAATRYESGIARLAGQPPAPPADPLAFW